MRRQHCTSSGPSNWTHDASVPGPSWVTNTWKWRMLRLPSRPTGQTEDIFYIVEHRWPLFWWISVSCSICKWWDFSLIARPFTAVWRIHTSCIVVAGCFLVFNIYSFLSGTPLKWTSGTTVPGMAWVRHMRSSRCPFTVCTIIERLTSSGTDFDNKKCFMQVFYKGWPEYFEASTVAMVFNLTITNWKLCF